VLAIFGPTGVGKTAVAIALAERLRGLGERPVAVSADALQVYAGLETLTGAASAGERRRLEHRLVSILPPRESFSAGRYAALAHAEIDGLLESGSLPLVVGGTGLYLRAALADLALRPPVARDVRERITSELGARGPEALHAELASKNAAVAAGIDPHDRQRIVRALELLESSGEAGGIGTPAGASRSQLWTEETRHPTFLAGLTMERAALYRRIDERVDAMVAAGVLAEVAAADRAGAGPSARKALGFQELLAGDVEAMKRRSRNYARRQLTWMRKLGGVRLFDLTGRRPADVAAEIAAAAGFG
jgi:tRNA dimethylallyltransferase